MQCAHCHTSNASEAGACSACGARLDAAAHKELALVNRLIQSLMTKSDAKKGSADKLLADYTKRREALLAKIGATTQGGATTLHIPTLALGQESATPVPVREIIDDSTKTAPHLDIEPDAVTQKISGEDMAHLVEDTLADDFTQAHTVRIADESQKIPEEAPSKTQTLKNNPESGVLNITVEHLNRSKLIDSPPAPKKNRPETQAAGTMLQRVADKLAASEAIDRATRTEPLGETETVGETRLTGVFGDAITSAAALAACALGVGAGFFLGAEHLSPALATGFALGAIAAAVAGWIRGGGVALALAVAFAWLFVQTAVTPEYEVFLDRIILWSGMSAMASLLGATGFRVTGWKPLKNMVNGIQAASVVFLVELGAAWLVLGDLDFASRDNAKSATLLLLTVSFSVSAWALRSAQWSFFASLSAGAVVLSQMNGNVAIAVGCGVWAGVLWAGSIFADSFRAPENSFGVRACSATFLAASAALLATHSGVHPVGATHWFGALAPFGFSVAATFFVARKLARKHA